MIWVTSKILHYFHNASNERIHSKLSKDQQTDLFSKDVNVLIGNHQNPRIFQNQAAFYKECIDLLSKDGRGQCGEFTKLKDPPFNWYTIQIIQHLESL